MKHPARLVEFDVLWDGLQKAVTDGFVRETKSDDGLSLFVYTEACTYEKAWNEFTILARGLILDPANKKVVATPFPKFFNLTEKPESVPDLPFETFEKLDGSLIIIFCYNGKWRCATKGSFNSTQAQWAQTQVDKVIKNFTFNDRVTLLAEAIYPENRIVVHYDYTDLVVLGGYMPDGDDMGYDTLTTLSKVIGWRLAKRYEYSHLSELMALVPVMTAAQEGFVLRFQDGHRLKIKGDEYCRIHRLISRLTPIAMWEAMMSHDDLEEIRKQLPEEFWTDFDFIIERLSLNMGSLIQEIKAEIKKVEQLSNKEIGLSLDKIPEHIRGFVFAWRKSENPMDDKRILEKLFKAIRPNGNILPGYTPSYAVNQVMSEV